MKQYLTLTFLAVFLLTPVILYAQAAEVIGSIPEPDPDCRQNQVIIHITVTQGFSTYTFCGWKATWLTGRTVLRLTGPDGERVDFSAPLEAWYFPAK